MDLANKYRNSRKNALKGAERRREFKAEQNRKDRQAELKRAQLGVKKQRMAQEHEKDMDYIKRSDAAAQKYYDRGRLQGVASGQKDPRRALMEISPTPEGLMTANPRFFGGGGSGGGSGSSGGGGGAGGLTSNQLVNTREAVDKYLSEQYDGLTGMGGEKPTDDTGNPITRQQYIDQNRDSLFKEWTKGAGGNQPPMPSMQESTAISRVKRDQNLENYQYGFMDDQGQYVDPRNVNMEMGKNGMRGVDDEGNTYSLYFRGAGVGRTSPEAGGKFDSGGYSAGNAIDFMNRAAKVRGTKSKAPEIASPRKTERSTEQEKSPKDVPSPQAAKQTDKSPRQKVDKQTDKQTEKRSARPHGIAEYYNSPRKNFTMVKPEEGDKPVIRQAKERINTWTDPEAIKGKIHDFGKWWAKTSERNIPDQSAQPDVAAIQESIVEQTGITPKEAGQAIQEAMKANPNISMDKLLEIILNSIKG